MEFESRILTAIEREVMMMQFDVYLFSFDTWSIHSPNQQDMTNRHC